ncbi:MAG TPA: toll/interleukin-1 receptor domain-containing protein, partial [Patescibacteria group bacterium]|nr:toll/interleukin-1 receptor domain-containing protein [Patescibacteria group bacterium]
MGPLTYKVFISYKRLTGEDFAIFLREGLENEGISAFLDVQDIPKKFDGKRKWWKYRDDALVHSEVFLLVITDGIENSGEVGKEVEMATERSMQCIYLRHRGLNTRAVLNLTKRKLDLGDFEQTEFDTKQDLLRKVLRIVRQESPKKGAPVRPQDT